MDDSVLQMQPHHIKKNRRFSPIGLTIIGMTITFGLVVFGKFYAPVSSKSRYRKGEEFMDEYIRVTTQKQLEKENSEMFRE